MAFPTSVNSQITDAVAQANVKVLADAPAMAMGSLYQTVAPGNRDRGAERGHDSAGEQPALAGHRHALRRVAPRIF